MMKAATAIEIDCQFLSVLIVFLLSPHIATNIMATIAGINPAKALLMAEISPT